MTVGYDIYKHEFEGDGQIEIRCEYLGATVEATHVGSVSSDGELHLRGYMEAFFACYDACEDEWGKIPFGSECNFFDDDDEHYICIPIAR